MPWAARRWRSASSPPTASVIRPAPARAAFGSMNSQACSSISQSTSSPTRLSGGRPKNRVYQSMLVSRSDTGTPANRWVIAPSCMRSAQDPVVQVGDTALPLKDPGALQLDLLGGEALEQTAPLAEEHRDDMELELVENARGECELRGGGAVDQHVLVARRLLGSSHRARHVVHVSDQRPLAHVDAGLVAAKDPDRHAVVMVAAPAAGRLEGPPAGDDRASGHELFDDLAVDTARPAGGLEVDVAARHRPFVQTVPAVAEPVARSLIRPGDESVERHGHVEHGCGHGGSFPRLRAAERTQQAGASSEGRSIVLPVQTGRRPTTNRGTAATTVSPRKLDYLPDRTAARRTGA